MNELMDEWLVKRILEWVGGWWADKMAILHLAILRDGWWADKMAG